MVTCTNRILRIYCPKQENLQTLKLFIPVISEVDIDDTVKV
jgi:hypothetical protein